MKYGILKIIGAIGSFKMPDGKEIKGIDLLDVIAQVKAAGEVDAYAVFIKSIGGVVTIGYEIHDYLKGLKKPIATIVDTECSSIATVPFLAGDVDKRFIIDGSKFLIHNPWTSESGDAAKLFNIAESLQEAEDEMLSFYSKQTGIPEAGIMPLMRRETDMTAEQAVRIGFASKVISREDAAQFGAVEMEDVSGKALAIYLKPNKTPMKNNNKKSLLDEIKALFKDNNIDDSALALDIKTADGKVVTIESAGEVPVVGDVVTIDGQPAPDVSLELEGGAVLKTDADSKVSFYTPVAVETEDQKAVRLAKEKEDSEKSDLEKLKGELEAEKAANADLKKEVDELKAAKLEDEKLTKELSDKFIVLAKAVKSKHTPTNEKTQFRGQVLENEDAGTKAAERVMAKYTKKKQS